LSESCRRHAFDFLKGTVEIIVVFEADLIHDLLDGDGRLLQKIPGSLYPQLHEIGAEGVPCDLPEEGAEVVG